MFMKRLNALRANLGSASPPDAAHPYGRFKAEYFASGIEGALIVFAAVSIARPGSTSNRSRSRGEY